MPFGSMRHGFTFQAAAGGGGGISTTTAFTKATAVSSIDGAYGGQGDGQRTWQGVFNTNYGVFVISYLNSAKTTYYVIPGVVDLTTGDIAMGTAVSIGNAHGSVSTGFSVSAKPGSTYGLVGGPIWTGSTWNGTYRGYTLSGTATASTTSVPTITLSSSLTETFSTNFFSGYTKHVIGDQFVFVNRCGAGDLTQSHFVTYTGSGTPSKYNSNTSTYGTSRSTGPTITFNTSLPANTVNSFSNTHGNNNNFTDLYVSCASTSSEADFQDQDRLDCSPTAGISGANFTCAVAYDTGGTWIGLSGLYSAQESQKLVAEKINSMSSSSISVSSGSVLSPANRIYSIDHLGKNGTVRGVVNGGTGTWFADITVNSSTLAVTYGTPYQVSTNTLSSINESNITNLVDATHGNWSMLTTNNSGNLDVSMVKVV